MNKKTTADKLGTKTIETKAVAKRLTPFEDLVHLAAIGRISLAGRQDIGAIILKKKDSFQIKFCFDCKGIHPSLPDEQVYPIFAGIEAGLKELPKGELLTLHMGSFTDDFDRQQTLKTIEENCAQDELKLLARSERLRMRELTKQGIRKTKFLRLYCTYTVAGAEETKTTDFVEKLMLQGQKTWHQFTGQIHQVRFHRIQSILKDSFHSGFLLWEQTLSNKMGLQIRPLSSTEIWQMLWVQFNSSMPPEVPYLIALDKQGLKEKATSDFHIRHLLIEREASLPFLDRAWVKLQNRYIGVAIFSEKPGGWLDEYSQLRYLWEVLAREQVSDTEIICQLSKANEALAKTALQRITKQSIVSSAISAEHNSVDVKAQLNVEDAIAAQEQIFRGSIPIHSAVVFLIHRQERHKLDEACRYISSCFLRPAVVVQEREYAWKIWLQCLPIVWENLLGNSTFTDYTQFMGRDGSYFDISKESNNLFELPDLRSLEKEQQKERLTDFKDFLKSALFTMVLGTNALGVDPTMVSNIESILTLAIETFFADDDIRMRYKQAIEKGLGTPEWYDTPTLQDFYNYCSPGYINLDAITNNSKEILASLDQIRLRLRFWLNSRVGQSISKPSSFRTDAKLLVFALRSLSSEADAAILTLSAYAAALRRAISSKVSILLYAKFKNSITTSNNSHSLIPSNFNSIIGIPSFNIYLLQISIPLLVSW